MKRPAALIASCLALAAFGLAALPAFTSPAEAVQQGANPLGIGSKAPLFKTQGALAGKTFNLDLAQQLKKGPVVLYFFPKVFTSGCTMEAHEFAERTPDFQKLGASVIGMSADGIDELARFSREACRDKFAVARATPEIVSGYGVALRPDGSMTSRTSYVIAPNGRVVFVHSNMDYRDHVKLTLDAVRKLSTKG